MICIAKPEINSGSVNDPTGYDASPHLSTNICTHRTYGDHPQKPFHCACISIVLVCLMGTSTSSTGRVIRRIPGNREFTGNISRTKRASRGLFECTGTCYRKMENVVTMTHQSKPRKHPFIFQLKYMWRFSIVLVWLGQPFLLYRSCVWLKTRSMSHTDLTKLVQSIECRSHQFIFPLTKTKAKQPKGITTAKHKR